MRKEYLLLVICCFVWGSGHPIGKLILREIHPIQLSMLSTILTFFVLALGLLLMGEFKKITALGRRGIILASIAGFLAFFAYPILSFSALQRIPASINSILVATSTIFATLMAIPMLKEKLRPVNYLGVVLAFCGVPILVLSGGDAFDFNRYSLLGILLSLGGSIAYAFYTITGRAAMSEYDAFSVTLIASLVGSVFQIVASTSLVGYKEILTASNAVVAMILYYGIFSGLGYAVYYQCLKRLEVARATAFVYLTPFFAVVSSFVILGEPMGISLIIGMAFIFMGLYLVQKRIARFKKDS